MMHFDTTRNLEEKPIESTLESMGLALSGAFSDLLASMPDLSRRPQSLARSLGLNTVLTSRLLRATQSKDPMAAVHTMPGPEPLRRVIKAAERNHADAASIERAEQVTDEFERLIRAEGDRSSLDAIISGWLPDVRDKVEVQAKQAMFRGASQLLGTACEVNLGAAMLHPNASDAARIDLLWIKGNLALRRVRPGAALKYAYQPLTATNVDFQTITGDRVDNLQGLLLEEFCSKPLPELKVITTGKTAHYALTGGAVGTRSAVDIVYGTVVEAALERHRGADERPRNTGVSLGIGIPARLLLLDVLVHEDLYPRQDPWVRVYRTVFDGLANPNDAGRDVDRIDVLESVQSLGVGIARVRAAEVPRYVDMVKVACEARGWDGSRFRCYRCRIEFPIYSSQVAVGFDLPLATTDER